MKGNAKAEVELQKFAAESQEKIAELEAVNSEIKETVIVITKYVDKVRTVKEKQLRRLSPQRPATSTVAAVD